MAKIPIKLAPVKGIAPNKLVTLSSSSDIGGGASCCSQDNHYTSDIDKELAVAGPCECGQMAVTCSIRMILEKQLFFCDACGFEFTGEEYPDFFENTVGVVSNNIEQQLFSDMKELYSFIHGASSNIRGNVLTRLLDDHPQYLDLFPVSVLPGEMIISRLEKDQTFAEEFEKKYANNYSWQNFSAENWINLFSLLPEMVDKCDKWESFTPAQWIQIKSGNYFVYSKYFNKKYLSTSNYLHCVAEEPTLLEKAAGDLKLELEDAADTIADAAKNLWRKLW